MSALFSCEYTVDWWTTIIDGSVSLCNLRLVRHSVVYYKASIIISPVANFNKFLKK